MSYDFSFTKREWWATVAGAVLFVLLMFAFGFVSGALWHRSPATADQAAPPASSPASAPAPAAPVKDAAPPPSPSAATLRAAADTRGC